MKALEQYDLFGLKISVFDKADLITFIDQAIIENKQQVCFGYSLGYLPLFKEIPGLYEITNRWDLMVTDGRHFYWFARLFGAPLKFDISIPFLTELMLERANEKQYSVLLIGSDEKTNTAATNFVKLNYPNAHVYNGRSGGNFSENEQLELVNYINKVKPDMLFIGTSTPIKEHFTEKWRDQLDTRLIVPFGGMIDGLAGKVKLSSPLLKKLGLATFVRIAQEPRRLFRKKFGQIAEFFFRILPITLLYKVILRRKNFNLVQKYLKQ